MSGMSVAMQGTAAERDREPIRDGGRFACAQPRSRLLGNDQVYLLYPGR